AGAGRGGRAGGGPALLPAPRRSGSRAGLGVEAVVEGRAVVVGRVSLLAERGLHLPSDLPRAQGLAEAARPTVAAVAWGGSVRGLLVLADRIKATSADA